MVTFFDVGLFQYFNVIFPILLIFSIVFAILHKTKILGENATINAVVAISLALMSLLSPTLIDVISFMAPWFVLVFIFVILLVLMYQLLGATEKDILGALKSEKTIQWAVIGVGVIILFAAFANVLGQKMLTMQPEAIEGEEAPSAFEKNIYTILFNPKVLGLIFVFLIAIFTVAFLAGG